MGSLDHELETFINIKGFDFNIVCSGDFKGHTSVVNSSTVCGHTDTQGNLSSHFEHDT